MILAIFSARINACGQVGKKVGIDLEACTLFIQAQITLAVTPDAFQEKVAKSDGPYPSGLIREHCSVHFCFIFFVGTVFW